MASPATANPRQIAIIAGLRARARREYEASQDPAQRAAARAHLMAFCRWTMPAYREAAHLQYVAGALECVERGEIKRLMVFVPPRHGKSELISVRFPGWYLLRNPARKVISVSHNEDLANEAGRQVRNIVMTQSLWPTVQLDPSSKAKGLWHTTAGGEYIAAGVGSAIVGKGGHLILIDDPHGKAKEIMSPAQREATWTYYRSELYNRREPGAAIVLIMHRWHEDDLAGKLLADDPDGWHVIRIPAVAEEDDILGRAVGQPLWPERYSLADLEETKRIVGEREWHAKYQQRPAPEEGAIYRWFPRYAPDALPRLVAIDIPIDTALGGEDETCAVAWGWDGSKVYWLDAMSYRGETPEAERRLVYFRNRVAQQYPGLPVAALHRGNVGIDKAMGQRLRVGAPAMLLPDDGDGAVSGRMGMGVTDVRLPAIQGTSDEKRQALARALSVEFEGGRALLPDFAGAELEKWIDQHKSFPFGRHDDYVETTHLVLWHRFRRAPFQRPEPQPLWGEL